MGLGVQVYTAVLHRSELHSETLSQKHNNNNIKGRLLGVEYSAEHYSINLVSIKIMIFWELERWLSG